MGRGEGASAEAILHGDGAFAGPQRRLELGPPPEKPRTSASRVARTVAAQLWPDVQDQTQLAPGIFNFSCAGHGGVVAVLGAAELDPEAIAAARQHGLTQHVLLQRTGNRFNRSRGKTEPRYKLKSDLRFDLESMKAAAEHDPQSQLVEVWVGEEDCDWATIAYCSPAMRAGQVKKLGAGGRYVSQRGAEECLERWNPEFLAMVRPFGRRWRGEDA
jgi:hypothetical protein